MLDYARRSTTVADLDAEFLVAGSQAKGAFQCCACGYGIAVQATLPHCPMCAGTAWERLRLFPGALVA